MLWGMILQISHLFNYAYMTAVSVRMKGGTGIHQSGLNLPTLNFSFLAWLVGGFGLLIFAIGLFLHARNQRGLQTRVDELERILADMHSRER